jgi:hypothetical protein
MAYIVTGIVLGVLALAGLLNALRSPTKRGLNGERLKVPR